jgi:hypothetical protein
LKTYRLSACLRHNGERRENIEKYVGIRKFFLKNDERRENIGKYVGIRKFFLKAD